MNEEFLLARQFIEKIPQTGHASLSSFCSLHLSLLHHLLILPSHSSPGLISDLKKEELAALMKLSVTNAVQFGLSRKNAAAEVEREASEDRLRLAPAGALQNCPGVAEK